MRFPFLLSLILLLFVFSCSAPVAEIKKTDVSLIHEVDSTIRDFFSWYKKNYDTINSYPMVVTGNGDTTIQYRLNKKGAEQYLASLQSSGKVTAGLISFYRKAFSICDSIMLADKQTDGPPYGFEADMILCSQDPESSFAEIEQVKQFDIKLQGDTAFATFGEGKTPLSLVHTNNSWLIDKIGCYNLQAN
jgi:hypothetical protein